ncbi:fructosamine kinase family protein [Haloechinothrix sp. YIM 98757]|uniref:Fructosamine kinase family protein n=1 Tax=Haloechinothrix aidingensis TaxID=2752311 RepID=A0A838AFF4_9PSEU|nr:fructosamine kinase family protein [Haloechinothrix aidingensis]MBA0127941.1 fructosamine kinase family protein [Haloechinothrix aidingensis]
MNARAAEPRQAAERLLATDIGEVTPLGGALFAATTADGQRLVAKRAPGPGAHAAEAAGLRWLAEPADVPVPAVYAHDEQWLLIERVDRGAPTAEAASEFGAGLARLHLRGAAAFGSPPPGGPTEAWIGLTGMRNIEEPDWPTFYARHRVAPYVRAARDSGAFGAEQAAVFDRVCDSLDALAGPAEPPARLHGDAWSGNVHWAGGVHGRVWLLDPAAHGGHRETDLAMLRLFGAPLLEHILDAYEQTASDAGAPLADGWTDRVGLHQLFPLLVHTVLFGGGYAGQALAAARSALALR